MHVGTRVVQLDRRRGVLRDEAGVVEKFGVVPESIPDYLALVGDSADGFPGVSGWGAKAAALTLSRLCPPGGHPQGLAGVASVNPESAHTGRDAVRRLERRSPVSHTGDAAVGCPDLRHGRRAPLDRPVHGLRGLLPPSSVPGPLRPHDIPFGQQLTGFGAKAETTKLLVKGESTEQRANMPAEFFHPTARSRLCQIASKKE